MATGKASAPVRGDPPAARAIYPQPLLVELDWEASADPLAQLGSGPGERLWAACSGMLCDAAELSRTLEVPAGTPRTDAQLVALAYERWGEEAPWHLLGSFAFVLFDSAKRRLVAATDPFGLVPLYFSQRGSRVALSTQTALLRRLPWVGSQPDEDTIAWSLAGAWPDPRRSPYRNISRLPGGYALQLDNRGTPALRRWWRPDQFAVPPARSTGELVEAFRELLLDAVRRRLTGHDRAALLMSGGFDSTTLAGAAAELQRRGEPLPQIELFSWEFGGLDCDERPRIELMRKQLPFPLHYISSMGKRTTPEMWHADTEHHDYPAFNGQGPQFADCISLLQTRRLDLVLDGIGGDELSVDYHYPVDVFRQLPWHRWPAAFLRCAEIEQEPYGRFAKQLVSRALPPPWMAAWRRLRARWRPGSIAAETCLQPATRARLRASVNELSQDTFSFGCHSQQLRWQIVTDPRTQQANAWWPCEFGRAGLRSISPFYDRRLFELVLAAPPHLLPRSYPSGQYKPLLVAAGQPWMPRELTLTYWKPTYESYMSHVLRLSLPALRAELFGAQPWLAEKYVSKAEAIKVLDRLDETAPNDVQGALIFRIQSIIGLELWLRALDSGGSERSGGSKRSGP